MKITQLLSITAAGALVVTGGVAAFRTASAEPSASPASAAPEASASPHKGFCHGFSKDGRGGDRGNFARWQHFRHGPGFGGDRGGDFGPGKMLNLTDDQKTKIKAIFQASRPQIEAIRKEENAKIQAVLADARKQIRPLLTDPQQQVFDDIAKLRADKASLAAPAASATPAAAQ